MILLWTYHVYLLAKNSYKVLNVHKLDFLERYFIMVFVYYTFFMSGCCCGKWKWDISFVLLPFVLFFFKVLTLSICKKTALQLFLETMYNVNKYNSSNSNKFFLTALYYGLSLLRTLKRERHVLYSMISLAFGWSAILHVNLDACYFPRLMFWNTFNVSGIWTSVHCFFFQTFFSP